MASLSGDTRTVDVDVPADLPLIAADPALLERVLANVIQDALDWAPPGLLGGLQLVLELLDAGAGGGALGLQLLATAGGLVELALQRGDVLLQLALRGRAGLGLLAAGASRSASRALRSDSSACSCSSPARARASRRSAISRSSSLPAASSAASRRVISWACSLRAASFSSRSSESFSLRFSRSASTAPLSSVTSSERWSSPP